MSEPLRRPVGDGAPDHLGAPTATVVTAEPSGSSEPPRSTDRARGKSRFERALSIVIGAIAVTASILAVLQQDASRLEERASLAASRLAAEAVYLTGTAFQPEYFNVQALVAGNSFWIEALQRAVAASTEGSQDLAAQEFVIAGADEAAAQRITGEGGIVAEMVRPPDEASGVDALARSMMAANPEVDPPRIVQEQNRQAADAERYSERGGRTVLALWILALAGVLAGVAGVFRSGPSGRITLGAAIACIVGSALWGASSLLV